MPATRARSVLGQLHALGLYWASYTGLSLNRWSQYRHRSASDEFRRTVLALAQHHTHPRDTARLHARHRCRRDGSEEKIMRRGGRVAGAATALVRQHTHGPADPARRPAQGCMRHTGNGGDTWQALEEDDGSQEPQAAGHIRGGDKGPVDKLVL